MAQASLENFRRGMVKYKHFTPKGDEQAASNFTLKMFLSADARPWYNVACSYFPLSKKHSDPHHLPVGSEETTRAFGFFWDLNILFCDVFPK